MYEGSPRLDERKAGHVADDVTRTVMKALGGGGTRAVISDPPLYTGGRRTTYVNDRQLQQTACACPASGRRVQEVFYATRPYPDSHRVAG